MNDVSLPQLLFYVELFFFTFIFFTFIYFYIYLCVYITDNIHLSNTIFPMCA